MKQVLSGARVPKPVARAVRTQLNRLADYLAWSTLEPSDDVPKIISQVALVAGKIGQGVRMEIISDIRQRATSLKKSDDGDDLVAAAELEDLANELEQPLLADHEEAACGG